MKPKIDTFHFSILKARKQKNQLLVSLSLVQAFDVIL